MAEKQGNKKNNSKGKKAVTGLIISILTPIIIIVMIANMFFWLLDAIIQIIEAIVTAITEFLKHPWQSIKIGWATVTNAISGLIGRRF